MKKLIFILPFLLLLSACTLKESIYPADAQSGLDDIEITFTKIKNIKMKATIDTTIWDMRFSNYDLDTGGYTLIGWDYETKGLLHKDTIFHTLSIDFVFPCVIELDTIYGHDDFYAYYTLDNNLATNNQIEFGAKQGGTIEVKGIDTLNKFVFGDFSFIAVNDTLSGSIKKKHTIENGTFSFNYQ